MGTKTKDKAEGGGAVVSQEVLTPALLHEMRQPLTGLKAAVQLLAREGGETLQKLEEWGLVEAQLARLEELLTTYQELTEPQRLKPRPFDVTPVVRRAVTLTAHLLRPLGDRVSVDIASSLPPALGAPNALLHALLNVVRNATEALAQAAPSSRLAVRVLHLPGAARAVQVRVSDEGIGVPEAHRARIFGPHFSTKRSERARGLGLYISRQMLAAAGGELELVPSDEPARLPWAHTELCIAFSSVGEEHPAVHPTHRHGS